MSIGVGVIGTGIMGSDHARTLAASIKGGAWKGRKRVSKPAGTGAGRRLGQPLR